MSLAVYMSSLDPVAHVLDGTLQQVALYLSGEETTQVKPVDIVAVVFGRVAISTQIKTILMPGNGMSMTTPLNSSISSVERV
jgi:hypothetical protein